MSDEQHAPSTVSRVESLEDAGYARGRKEADIAAHTREQDKHLAAINGSIADSAKALHGVQEHIETLEDKIDGLIAEQGRRVLVNSELVKAEANRATAAARLAAKKLTRIQISGLIVGVLIAAGSLAFAIVEALAR